VRSQPRQSPPPSRCGALPCSVRSTPSSGDVRRTAQQRRQHVHTMPALSVLRRPASPTRGRQSAGLAPTPARVPVSVSCGASRRMKETRECRQRSSGACPGLCHDLVRFVAGPARPGRGAAAHQDHLACGSCDHRLPFLRSSHASTSTSGDVAMEVVRWPLLNNVFFADCTDSEPDHDQSPAAPPFVEQAVA